MKNLIILICVIAFSVLTIFATTRKDTKLEPPTDSEIVTALQNLVTPLTYIGETDETPSVFISDNSFKANTVNALRKAATIDVSIPIVIRPTSEFFEPQISQNILWQILLDYEENTLIDVKVYRVGETQITYYAVGLSPTTNKLIGVVVDAVET